MTILAMFPIIPAHLSVRPPLPASQHRKKVQVPVVAADDIPAHARTSAIPLDTVIKAKLDRNKYELGMDKSDLLVDMSGGSAAWIRYARVSPDCHSYNVIVQRVTDQASVILQTVRELKTGEELCLWFDEDILALAEIPFLTPINIQGEKNYVCHLCRKRFEYPNPLKIHIALECGTLRRIDLWKRLKPIKELKPSHSTDELALKKLCDFTVNSTYSFKEFPKAMMSSAPSSPGNFGLTSTSIVTSPKSVDELDRPSSEPALGRYSAFKPYLSFQTCKENSSECKSSSHVVTVPSNLIFSSPTFYASQNPPRMVQPPLPRLSFSNKDAQTSFMDQQAAEVETLVSNLGRSKQGHLCIYCGKVYSRKYGLKIHIRTHTGFKPLKCKFCLRPFGDPSNLNKHVRLHAEGETPYKCEECGKVLVRRRDLERHIKSRHQQEDC